MLNKKMLPTFCLPLFLRFLFLSQNASHFKQFSTFSCHLLHLWYNLKHSVTVTTSHTNVSRSSWFCWHCCCIDNYYLLAENISFTNSWLQDLLNELLFLPWHWWWQMSTEQVTHPSILYLYFLFPLLPFPFSTSFIGWPFP